MPTTNGSQKRLEILLTAAFLEWAKAIPHDRALELAEAGPSHWLFRGLAENLAAYFSGGKRDAEAPLILIEAPRRSPLAQRLLDAEERRVRRAAGAVK